MRVVFPADLSGMAVKMQIDVGFGDTVVPDLDWIEYPQILDLGQPRLLGYPPEATLAEKLHAIVNLGLANSRMKDYYHLWTVQRLGIATPERLGIALRPTFARRETAIPVELPEGLTEVFANDEAKRAQWAGFLRKSRLAAPDLVQVVAMELAPRPSLQALRHAERRVAGPRTWRSCGADPGAAVRPRVPTPPGPQRLRRRSVSWAPAPTQPSPVSAGAAEGR